MTVTTEIQDNIAVIRMDDGKANAMNPELIAGLNEALDKAEADAKAIVLLGRKGSMFTGGFDLSVFAGGDAQRLQDMLHGGFTMFNRMYNLKMPFVTGSEGHVMAGGVIIKQTADYRVIPSNVGGKFSMNETKAGIPLGDFIVTLVPSRVSRNEVIPCLQHSKQYDAAGAVAAGLMDEAVPQEKVVETCIQRATELSSFNPAIYATNKAFVRKPIAAQLAKDLESMLNGDMGI